MKEHPIIVRSDRGYFIALLVLTVGVFTMVVWLCVVRYLGFNAKYFDLGAMSQAVWSVTHAKPLVFTGHGFPLSRLARHVEVFYFLLAPFYAVAPTPLTLIVIQAALFVLGALPLFRLARRHLQAPFMAVLIVAIYLFYPTAQEAIFFDFHGDALAMPLLLFAIDAADQKAERICLFWTALALSAKFYVAVPIMLMAGILWLKKQRRLGLYMGIMALVWGLIAFTVIRPAFAPTGEEAVIARATAETYLGSRFQELDLAATGMLRLVHLFVVAAPAIIVLGWRAPKYLLPAAAIIVPAVLSSGFGPAFSYRTHHYAVAVPFLLAAVVHGASGLRARQMAATNSSQAKANAWRGRIVLTLAVTLVFNIAFVDTPLSPIFYEASGRDGRGLDSSRFGMTERDRFKARWLVRNVPTGPIAADETTATRLVNRHTLYITERPVTMPLDELLPRVDHVLVDVFSQNPMADPTEPDKALGLGVRKELDTLALLLNDPEFDLIASSDGLLLFGRDGNAISQDAFLIPTEAHFWDDEATLAEFGDAIALKDIAIEKIGERKFRTTYYWIALQDLTQKVPFFAVSELAGVPFSRIVHLPTFAALPTNKWEQGDLIREQLEFEVAEDIEPGTFSLIVGWYDTSKLYATETDERSRVGDFRRVGVLVVQ